MNTQALSSDRQPSKGTSILFSLWIGGTIGITLYLLGRLGYHYALFSQNSYDISGSAWLGICYMLLIFLPLWIVLISWWNIRRQGIGRYTSALLCLLITVISLLSWMLCSDPVPIEGIEAEPAAIYFGQLYYGMFFTLFLIACLTLLFLHAKKAPVGYPLFALAVNH